MSFKCTKLSDILLRTYKSSCECELCRVAATVVVRVTEVFCHRAESVLSSSIWIGERMKLLQVFSNFCCLVML